MTTETELQIELEPLPSPFGLLPVVDSCRTKKVYSADQMRAYAEAAYRAGYERRYLENLGALA